jgi:hypothetical protein
MRPQEQFETLDPRNNDIIYALDTPAELALKEHGLWSDYAVKHGRAWKHDYAVGAITSSIELGTLGTNIRYIPGHKILARAETTLSFPTTIEGATVNLYPDGLFGLEYIHDSEKYYRFYCLEFDRGTEPVKGKKYSRKSHERNVAQYRQFIAEGKYKDMLGLSAGMMVLYVTTSEARMQHLMEITDNNYSLFAHASQLGGIFKPVKPLDLFTRPWQRHKRHDFYICQVDGSSATGTV